MVPSLVVLVMLFGVVAAVTVAVTSTIVISILTTFTAALYLARPAIRSTSISLWLGSDWDIDTMAVRVVKLGCGASLVWMVVMIALGYGFRVVHLSLA